MTLRPKLWELWCYTIILRSCRILSINSILISRRLLCLEMILGTLHAYRRCWGMMMHNDDAVVCDCHKP